MNGWSKEDLEEMCGDDIIEQLAFLSGCHQHQLCNSNPSGWIVPDESLRKFAELIVGECMTIVLKESKWYWDKNEVESSNAIQNAARRLKEQFKVQD